MKKAPLIVTGALTAAVVGIAAMIAVTPTPQTDEALDEYTVLLRQEAYLCGALDMATFSKVGEVTPGACEEVRKLVLDNWTDKSHIPEFLTAPVQK